jgi:tetratricopeptide (TPR) repeat protein
VGTSAEFPISMIASEETAAAAPLLAETPFDISPRAASDQTGQTLELDLSGDLEAIAEFGYDVPTPFVPDQDAPPQVEIPAPIEISTSPKEPGPLPVLEEATPTLKTSPQVPEAPPGFVEERITVNLRDSRIELEFYLENGFVDEARQAVAALEEKYPGSPLVAEFRQRLNERPGEASPKKLLEQFAPADEILKAEPLVEVVQAKPEFAPPPVPKPVEQEVALEEWELPTDYAVPPQPEPAVGPVVPPPVIKPEASPAPESAVNVPAAAEGGGMEMLGGLAEDLASSIDKLAASTSSPAVPGPPRADPSQGVAQLSGLLDEMEEPSTASATKDDPETHYNLGVAFREMGLLDESIGEFQKVVRGSGRGNYPQNFLQACSLLAICFMDKKMPAIAVKWYKRAMETPGLDEEALMALEYDLGVAYEQAGDSRNALERYTEVYSQNIDFRDVADKIRDLQQKA